MLAESKLLIEGKTKMLSVSFPPNGDAVENEWRMIGFLSPLLRENNLNGLLGNVWVELHLPLVGPLGDQVKVICQGSLANLNIANTKKKG